MRRVDLQLAFPFVLLALSIVAPLAATSYSVAVQNAATARTRAAAELWLEGTDYRLAGIQVDETRVTVIATGTGRRPRASELAERLSGRLFGRELVVETVPQLRETFSTK